MVKLGADGALCVDGTHSCRIDPPGGRSVVDTTGAGDCFNAGLIAGLLQGDDLCSAARLGCAAGTASTWAAGGTSAAPDLATALSLAAVAVIRPAGI